MKRRLEGRKKPRLIFWTVAEPTQLHAATRTRFAILYGPYLSQNKPPLGWQIPFMPGYILATTWSQQDVRLVHCYHIWQWPI